MENEEEIIEKIITAIEENDEKKIIEIIKMISKDFDFRKYDWISEIFSSSRLDSDTKFKFCLMAIDLKDNEEADINNFFCRQVVPDLLLRCIRDNEEEFSKLVSENEEMQELLIKYIREYPDDAIVIWHKVSSLPLVKQRILEDEEFVASKMGEYEDFFKNLPQDYAHLICYYNAQANEYEFEMLKSLYGKYIGSITGDEDQSLLVALHYILEKRNKMGVSPRIAMQPMRFYIKRIMEDKEFNKEVEIIEKKSNMNFVSTISFISNYYSTELYRELLDIDSIDDDLREKLEYLSKVDKVIKIEKLSDLTNVSLDELEMMEKEPIVVSGLVTSGGPTSRILSSIFPDSANREIRSIKRDGSTRKLVVGNQESHESKVEEIYEDDIEFPDDCTTAWQRSIECAKQLSAITLVIESEQCHLYMPSNITDEQNEVLMKLLESTEERGRFGVAVYDKDGDRIYISGIELLDREDTRNFIQRLNERNLQNSKDEGIIQVLPDININSDGQENEI
ncbi:MAG: hypothetical protein IKG56_02790 [Clostridia bacterium]|nr:hypothetical protein [Clostridia bacterium]